MSERISRHALDGNAAVASVAYRASDVIAIYPITPASAMGELSDEWAAQGKPNLWGGTPGVIEMQSEAGAAGAVHGAIQAGSLSTTFTASQGLLLMIPSMYKIAGELTPCCIHVAARTIATHALSIFGDHSDVMACRQTGFAMLASASVQEAHDLAAVAHAATLRSRIPFLHFMDGFRTSHEVATVEELTDEQLKSLLPDDLISAHRDRALTPDHPVLRGSAQNPDAFFQAREACNSFYDDCPGIVQEEMDKLAELTGRRYRIFDYEGHPEAEKVVVVMASGAETVHQTVNWMVDRGEKVGVLKVRLYRPFASEAFRAALPPTVRSLAVLDRTKEPGAPAEPLHLDVVTAIDAAQNGAAPRPRVIGGRYGLSGKDFTPAMVKAVFDELGSDQPRRIFTVGIVDDVTRLSLSHDAGLDIEGQETVRATFYGLGSDGTVGANKNSVKIMAEEQGLYSQGFFEYDSKKAGAVTVSHLRFGPEPIAAPYLPHEASFIACHQFSFLDQFDVLAKAAPGAVLLINAPYAADHLWDELPREVQEGIVERKLRVFCIDAEKVASDAGVGRRINTVMQTCFFQLSGLLNAEEAVRQVKISVTKAYGKKSDEVVARNHRAVDDALGALAEVTVPGTITTERPRPPVVAAEAPDFVQRVTAMMLARKGDDLPVSAFPVDGTWPVGTARWEKRNLAKEIPVWDPDICIQCNKCALVCPHSAIRAKVYQPEDLEAAPAGFQSMDWKGKDFEGMSYTLQVAPEDCTGCTLCVRVCPAKDKTNPRHKALDLAELAPRRDGDREHYSFFLDLPEVDRTTVKLDNKGSQLLQPLFEYSGACVGCGETPYIKLMTQLFGDRSIVANATGCSSIYGGNLPTTPYCTNSEGRGPAWSNSLFEDNAEFGLGLRLGVDALARRSRALVERLSGSIGDELTALLLAPVEDGEAALRDRREQVAALREILTGLDSDDARALGGLADYLVPKNVWIVGGDGWAYDIGFSGLDHVLATGANVNLLVLDTEVYSNTGGQASKATPLGAAAKFASAGKSSAKKDLGLIAMTYGNVYVAHVAFGAKDAQTVNAFTEAVSYPGPSLILAYSHCIAHGYDLSFGLDQQRLAVDSGHWPLYRFDPRRTGDGKNPLVMDSGPPKVDIEKFARNEARFRMVERNDPARYRKLMRAASAQARSRYDVYKQLADLQLRVAGGK